MKKFLIIFLFIFIPFSVNADNNINKVFKLESYKYDEFSNSFKLIQYGSAVYINKGLIYTNAHVVLDEENKPIGNYKVCKTLSFKDKPKCFTVGKLLYYDTNKDLAILQIGDPSVKTVKFSNKKLDIGDVVKVYGYPSNGGETITYTEGKISGYEKGLYKIDANIDAGNSGGGVFDSEGELIGIAVSVRVGYTTLGYIIPVSDIKDFQKRKNKEDIKIYNKKTNPKFVFYTVLLRKIIGKTKFKNHLLKINDFRKYAFSVANYNIDINKQFFSLILTNKENNVAIAIYNTYFSGEKEITLGYLLDLSKDSMKDSLSTNKDMKYKGKQIKFGDKKANLQILTYKKDFILITFTVQISRNNFQEIVIMSDKMNKKALNNALRIILKKISFNNKEVIKSNNNKLYNLKIPKNKNFSIGQTIKESRLAFIGENKDINIEVYNDIGKKMSNDTTLSSYLQSYIYAFNKDYYYYNFLGIKKTNSGEKYIYIFSLNNKNKYLEKENKKLKKYRIIANFFEKKDDKRYYLTKLIFTFDKIKSKKIIDNFIDNIKTTSGINPYELGELKIGENLIEKEEFEFKD